MALIVVAVNKSNLAEISDYNVHVSINDQHTIFAGRITGHRRTDGAAELLRRIADEMDAHPRSQPGRKTNETK